MLTADRSANRLWKIALLIAGLLTPLHPAQAIVTGPSLQNSDEMFQEWFEDPDIQKLTRFSDIIKLLRAGEIEKGRLMLVKYLQANPRDGAGLELAGLILIQKNDLGNAALSLREALAYEPGRLSARAKLGVVLLLAGKTAEGEQMLRTVLKEKPDDALSYYYLGWSAMRGGNSASAIRHLERFFTIRPAKRLERGHIALATSYNTVGRHQDTARLLTPFLDSPSAKPASTQENLISAQANLLLAEVFIEARDKNRAQPLAAKAASLLPEKDASLRITQAQLANLNNESGKARALLLAVIKDTPENAAPAHYELAKIEFGLGNYDQAIAELNNARKSTKAESQTSLLRDISAVLLSNNRADEALRILAASATEFPDMPEVVFLLAEAQTSSGNVKDGLATLEKIIASHPDYAPSYYLAGVIKWSAGAKAEAEALFEQAVKRDPADVRSWLTLAGTRDTEDRRAEMRQTLVEALIANPDDPSLLYELAAVDYTIGDIAAAEAGYRKVLVIDPENIPAMNNLAALLADTPATVKEALAMAEKVYGLAKEEPVVQDTYGWTLFRSGDVAKARQILEKSILAQPEDGVANYHLGAVYLQAGDKAAAAKYLRKAATFSVPKQVREQIIELLKQVE